MKKLMAVLALCLIAGCSSQKETVEVEYHNTRHNEIADKVLGDPLGRDETQKIFDTTEQIDVYYDQLNEEKVTLTIFNNMDYYFTGTVDFDVCPVKLSVKALAPYGYASATVVCPAFIDDDEYVYDGQLFERNGEYVYNVNYESYYYEDDDALFDYVLDLKTISEDDLKELAQFLYTENVLANYEGEMRVKVYPMEAYNVAFNDGSVEAWTALDEISLAARMWIDAANDFVEIYDADGELIERVNYR